MTASSDEIDPKVLAALEGERPGAVDEPEEDVPPQKPDRANGPPRRVVKRNAQGAPSKGQPDAATVANAPFPKFPHIGYGAHPGIFTGVGSMANSADSTLVWGMIVEELYGIQSSPDMVSIEVFRIPRGPQQMEQQRMAQDIEGAVVAGGDGVSPGQALLDYVVNVYHYGSPHGAKYELRFYWKRNNATIRRNTYINLDTWEQIEQQRRRAEVHLRQRGASASAQESPWQPPAQAPYAPTSRGYAPQGGYALPQAPYGMGAPPPQAPDPGIEALRRDLGAMLARASGADSLKAELQQIVAKLQPAAPPPSAAAAVPLTREDIVRIVLDVQKATAQVAPAQASAADAPVAPRDPIGAALDDIERVEGHKRRLAKTLGVDLDAEEPEPATPAVAATVIDENKPPFGVAPIPFTSFGEGGKPINWVTGVEGGMMAQAQAFLAANPEIGIAAFKVVANIADKGVLGQILVMMQRGTPQQQAVAQQAVREGLVNGAAAQATSPVEPWTPTP